MAFALHSYSSLDENNQSITVRRYQIREKIFSIHDKFNIKDESAEDVFTVRSKLLSIGNQLLLEDMSGKGLIQIQEQVMHFHRTYNILSACDGNLDRPLAVIKKKFTFIQPKFDIDSVYGQYSLDSVNVLAHSFTLTKNGKIIATINKTFFSMTDSYGVEVANNENQAFILALVIIIDQILYDR